MGIVFLGTHIVPLQSAWAASPPPGIVIENQATGSYFNPVSSDRVELESNIVQVTVAEVAGISLRPTGIEEAPNTSSNSGPAQGNNNIDSEDLLYFTFTATNVGNDPTQLFIPGAPVSITGGTQAGALEIIAYDRDGPTGSVAETNLSSLPITIRPEGNNTGDATVLGLPVGAIPASGTVTIRVPMKVNPNLPMGAVVSVTLGDTAPNDNTAATQNQPYSLSNAGNAPAGGFDFYTQDNQDTDNITGEADGLPHNGDATLHRQEASATLSSVLGPIVTELRDYGDAPDTYGTDIIAANSSGDPVGASHLIVNGLHLGSTVPDADNNGFVDGTDDSLTANDDDASVVIGNGDDEDGILLFPQLTEIDQKYTIDRSNIIVTNTTGGPATLHAWIDFNQDGKFEAVEHTSITINDALNAGNPARDLEWIGLSGLSAGDTYIRTRLTTDSSINANTPGGEANDGEVEDHQIEIISGDGLSHISGTVFEDFASGTPTHDGNDTLDLNEAGLSNVTVTLYLDDGDGIFEPGSGDTIVGNLESTDASGEYNFTSLLSGNYWVAVEPTDPDLGGAVYGGDNAIANGATANPRRVSLTTTPQIANFPFDSEGLAGPTFACDGSLFQALGNPAQVKLIDTANNQLINAPGFPADLGGGFNSTGFNVQDGYVYGNRGGTIFRMGSTGQLENLGNPNNLPDTKIFVGDVNIDGVYYVLHQNNDVSPTIRSLYRLDVSGSTATVVGTPTISNTPGIADFAFNPLNSLLYSVKGNGEVIEIDPDTGNTRTISTHNNSGSGGFGAVYFDAFGNLYAYRNNTGTLWKYTLDLTTGSETASGTVFASGDIVTQNDGFSCPYQVRLEKTVTSGQTNGSGTATASPSDTVTYTYRIVNANPITIGGLNFKDIMGDGRVYVNSTIRQDGVLTTTPLGGTLNIYGGSNILDITDFSIPAGVIVTLSVDVVIPNNTPQGTLYNQAMITSIPPGFGGGVGTTRSDYPNTPAYGDPTPLEIVFGNSPNVLLVKRITAINESKINRQDPGNIVQLDRYDEDDTFPYDDNLPEAGTSPPDTDLWPNTTFDTDSTFLIGARDGGITEATDEIEYTIYFLSAGDEPATNVIFCDRIPDGQTFVPNPIFTGLSPAAIPSTTGLSGENRGILVSHHGSNTIYTNIGGDDTARFYPPGSGLPAACNLLNNQFEHNGAVVVNLGDLPQATAPSIPNTSYGFVRFRATVDP